MKKAWILAVVGTLALFFVACGGGGGTTGGGSTPTVSSQTPTGGSKTPTVVVTVGELVQITGTPDFTLTPNILEMKVGKGYKVQLLNRGNNSYRLRIPRWDVMLFAVAGADSEVSKAFIPDTPGDFDCFEEFNAARHDMRCTVRVSP